MQRRFRAKGIFATALTLFLCLSMLICNYAVFAEEADAVQKKDENGYEVQKRESTEIDVQEQTDAAEEKEEHEINSEVKTNSESAEKSDAAKSDSADGKVGGGSGHS